MDESTDKLIKALGFFSADDVKKLQTKLAKAANSIVNDGLSYKLEPFYSEEKKAERAKYDEFNR